MEKISRILPPNARTGSYDASRAQPARPGAPTIGRPQNMDSVVDRVTLSEQLTDSLHDMDSASVPIEQKQNLQNSKLAASQYKSADSVKAQLVREMTDRFFAKGPTAKDLVKESDQTHSEEVVSRALEATESNVKPDSSKELSL